MLVPVLIYADVPAQVPARGRFAADERTAGGKIEPNGGSERRILVAVEADSRPAGVQKGLDLVREVLGDLITGDSKVEESTDPNAS